MRTMSFPRAALRYFRLLMRFVPIAGNIEVRISLRQVSKKSGIMSEPEGYAQITLDKPLAFAIVGVFLKS